jgi:hypothetical protein
MKKTPKILPTYYKSKGTPIFRDTTTLPFAEGGTIVFEPSEYGSDAREQYPDGGRLGKGAFYASPYYMNQLTGSYVPSAGLGFSTVPQKGRGKAGWSFSGQAGIPYEKFDASTTQSFSGLEAVEIGENVNDFDPIKGLHGALPINLGANARYVGIPNYGRQGKGVVDIAADYSPSGGLGLSATGGLQFQFGRENYSRGELRPGYAMGTLTPYGGIAASTSPTKNKTGLTYGLRAEGEWKPELLRNTPFSLYGKGYVGASPGMGKKETEVTGSYITPQGTIGVQTAKQDNSLTWRPTFGGEVGVRMPVQQLKDIDLPTIPMPNLSPLTGMFNSRKDEEAAAEIPIEDGIGWGDKNRVNASTLEGQDIYVPSRSIPNGMPIEVPNPEDTSNQFADGGTVYTYSKRPGAYYQKSEDGWLIKNPSTGGKYIPITDPTGERAALLAKYAKPQTNTLAKGGFLNQYPLGGDLTGEPVVPVQPTTPPDTNPANPTVVNATGVQDFYTNWYSKRTLPFAEIGNKQYEKVMRSVLPAYNPQSPLINDITQKAVPYEVQPMIEDDPTATGALVYNKQGMPEKIQLKESILGNPKELDSTLVHEEHTRIMNPFADKVLPAEQMIINPSIKTFEEGWGNLKGEAADQAGEYYDYITDPQGGNIQSMLFEVRKSKNLQPNQVITDQDIESWKQEAEQSGALDPNNANYDNALYNLFKLGKDNTSIKNLFNYIAANKTQQPNAMSGSIENMG